VEGHDQIFLVPPLLRRTGAPHFQIRSGATACVIEVPDPLLGLWDFHWRLSRMPSWGSTSRLFKGYN